MKPEGADQLNQLQHLKVTLLFAYSGIANKKIVEQNARWVI